MHKADSSTLPFAPPAIEKSNHGPFKIRRWIYPLLVTLIYLAWLSYMFISENWGIFTHYWPVSVTMAFGSFIAGATPLGSASVAFPVFTKMLHFPSNEARTFGLVIQAIGMTMASVLIIAKRIPILPHIIGWSSLGGALGIGLGIFLFQIPAPFPKLLFTFTATAFGMALAYSRWGIQWTPLPDVLGWGNNHRLIFTAVGFFGGVFSANTGAGTNLWIFIVLILAFGVDEKISIPTSVVIMGINAFVGAFFYIFIKQEVGIVWNYWLVAVPIVILGAPLGAYLVSKVHRDVLISLILFLIGVEVATTLWLIPFDRNLTAVMVAALLFSIIWFVGMLYYRQKILIQKIEAS